MEGARGAAAALLAFAAAFAAAMQLNLVKVKGWNVRKDGRRESREKVGLGLGPEAIRRRGYTRLLSWWNCDADGGQVENKPVGIRQGTTNKPTRKCARKIREDAE